MTAFYHPFYFRLRYLGSVDLGCKRAHANPWKYAKKKFFLLTRVYQQGLRGSNK